MANGKAECTADFITEAEVGDLSAEWMPSARAIDYLTFASVDLRELLGARSMANRCFSPRTNKMPSEMAGVAMHGSPSEHLR